MTQKKRADELGQYLITHGNHKGKGWAELLAIQDEIGADISNGYPLKTIWKYRKEVKKQTNASYHQFLRFVKKQKLIKETDDENISAKGENMAGGKTEKGSKEPVNKKPIKEGFVFNPVPNKEDLY